MRNLLFLAIIAAAAFMAGWFTISRDGEHTTIQFNRNEIRNDAKVAIDRGREILNKQVQPQTQNVPTQYAPQPDQYAQPYPQIGAPSPQPPVQYQSWQDDRTAANPQADWNQQRSNYPPARPASTQATRWQQPPPYPSSQNPESPYPGQPGKYQAPRQY